MLYDNLYDNLLYLLRSLPFAMEEQVKLFFANSEGADKIPELLNRLVNDQIITRHTQYDKYDVIAVVRPIRFERRVVHDMLKAFWVVAHMGAENVRYVIPSARPPYYTIMLEPDDGDEKQKERTYDISVCYSAEDAHIAYMFRQDDLDNEQTDVEKNLPDPVIHIALVPSKEEGEAIKMYLKRYRFSNYCVVDDEKRTIRYYEVGE